MSEFIVRNGTNRNGTAVDIEIRNKIIDKILPAGEGDWGSFEKERRFDAAGRLVTPPLTEPHTHLFNALTEGYPHTNQKGTLEQAWRTSTKNRQGRTKATIKRQARKVLYWFATYGITRVRSHLSISDVEKNRYTSAEAMLDLQQEFSGLIDLQLVAIPKIGFANDEDLYDQFQTMLEMGLDVVGGMPHAEHTREKGVHHTHTAIDLAERYNLPVDFHIDETDDPNSRYTEVLAARAQELSIGDRVTASHVTAMHSYPNAYADKLSRLLAESGVSVITNPLSNSVLQGRYDDYPRRRGHTRIDELTDAGVTVGVGQDDISDSANPYGDGDPLKVLFFLAHFAHKNRLDDVTSLWSMLIENNALIYGVNPSEYGLREGNEGSVIVYDSTTPFDAIRTIAPRTLVLRDGDPIARTNRSATVFDDDAHAVDFDREL